MQMGEKACVFLWFKAGERLPVGRYDARVLQQNVQEGEMSHATRKMPGKMLERAVEKEVFLLASKIVWAAL